MWVYFESLGLRLWSRGCSPRLKGCRRVDIDITSIAGDKTSRGEDEEATNSVLGKEGESGSGEYKYDTRPREEDEENGLQELGIKIVRVVRTIEQLYQITEASVRTKLQIKNTVGKLRRQANDISRE
ncbi:hypothetical protein Trydic_g20820 [Trypoxylus dichotomus]